MGIIPYLHFIFFPFLFVIQIFNFIKEGVGKHLYLIDFPICIHGLIVVYILLFIDNHHLFSLCWILSTGWSAFVILIYDEKIYFDLAHFYPFYIHFAPPLLLQCAHKPELIVNFLLPDIGIMLSVAAFVVWSIVNWLVIKYVYKSDKDFNSTRIPFVQICVQVIRRCYPSKLKCINNNIGTVYVVYVCFNIIYMIISGCLSILLFKYPLANRLFLLSLFVLGAVRGFDKFLKEIDKEMKLMD